MYKEQEIKELLAMRKQIVARLEELLHQKVEGKEAEDKFFFEDGLKAIKEKKLA